jgi:hypothetical protein
VLPAAAREVVDDLLARLDRAATGRISGIGGALGSPERLR